MMEAIKRKPNTCTCGAFTYGKKCRSCYEKKIGQPLSRIKRRGE